MKFSKFLFIAFSLLVLSSCSSDDDGGNSPERESINKTLTAYDLWLVEPNQANGEISFIQDAVTFSFDGDQITGKYNLVNYDPNTEGDAVGNYTIEELSKTDVRLTANNIEFKVFGTAKNGIKLVDAASGEKFYLTGFQKNDFPIDHVLYIKLPHLFEEYKVWKKESSEIPAGADSDFMSTNFLKFETVRQFKSSPNQSTTPIDEINYIAEGSYGVKQVEANETQGTTFHDQVILSYSSESERVNDTLDVYNLTDTGFELIEPRIQAVYTFKGVENTPF